MCLLFVHCTNFNIFVSIDFGFNFIFFVFVLIVSVRLVGTRSLSNNELQNNLQHAMFSNLTSLTSLKLRSNSIKELITGVFRGLLKLTVL